MILKSHSEVTRNSCDSFSRRSVKNELARTWIFSRVGRGRDALAFSLCHLRYCRQRRKILGLWDHLRAARLVNVQRHLRTLNNLGSCVRNSVPKFLGKRDFTVPSGDIEMKMWWKLSVFERGAFLRTSYNWIPITFAKVFNSTKESERFQFRKLRNRLRVSTRYNCITASSCFNFLNLKFQSDLLTFWHSTENEEISSN